MRLRIEIRWWVFLAMGFMGSFNLGLVFFVKFLFFFSKKKKKIILTVVICTKTQEIVDGYIVFLGIMDWIIYLFLFQFHLLVFLFDGVGYDGKKK